MNDIHRLSGAYALNAVDEFERAQFERHLAECEDCRIEVASLRETAALLAESAAVTPPPSLRDSVLAGISHVRPLPPIVEPSPRRAAWFPFLVAASILAVLGVGISVWQPWSAPDEPELSATELVLAAPDARSVRVDLGEAGRATVTRSVELGQAVITTEDMVSAPDGKVYELWLQSSEGEMLPAGLMPDETDQTMLLEGDAADATAAGITIEPDGGSPAPTSDPIALFDFTEET